MLCTYYTHWDVIEGLGIRDKFSIVVCFDIDLPKIVKYEWNLNIRYLGGENGALSCLRCSLSLLIECFPIARETKSLKTSCLGQCCLHQNSARGFGAYTKNSFWTDTQVHMIVIRSLKKNLHNKVVLE